MDTIKIAREIFIAGVKSVSPHNLIHNSIQMRNGILSGGDFHFDLSKIKHVYVIGVGKASGQMAYEIESILGSYITEGIVITKYGHASNTRKIRIIEAGHPVPDINGVKGTSQILEIVRKVHDDDLVLVLISGGGSSLLADIPIGSSLEELKSLNELLLNCGASIKEFNIIRKHLSTIKGGQLVSKLFPAQLLCFIISDVVGDALEVIASGPTVPDPSTFFDAVEILEKYNLMSKISPSLLNYLFQGIKGEIAETPKPDSIYFQKVKNLVIGSNKIALLKASEESKRLGLHPIILDSTFEGDTIEVANRIIIDALRIQHDTEFPKPACLLYGGESSLKVSKTGTGGRNQHLALYALKKLRGRKGITILSAGTDGTDGPTDAAGAVIDSELYTAANLKSFKIDKFLKAFDSYNFFKETGGHIKTGPTLTNVMDLIVVIVE